MGITKTVGVKLSESEYERFNTYVNAHNITASAAIKLFVSGLLNGEIEIEKGELKNTVNHDGYAVCNDFEDSFSRKVNRRFDVLRDREYPEEYIEAMKDEIINGIENRIGMLPKRFDRRKIKDSDCGC